MANAARASYNAAVRKAAAQGIHLPAPTAQAKQTIAHKAFVEGLHSALLVSAAIALSAVPVATIVALKPSLEQSTLMAEQRVIGTLIGAVLAAGLLLTVESKHVLVAVIVVFVAAMASVIKVNYALFCFGLAVAVLIALASLIWVPIGVWVGMRPKVADVSPPTRC